MLRYLLFDLDETLYTPQTGLWDAIGERITRYMQERLGLSLKDAQALRLRYRRQYGVALTGLLNEHAINVDDYLAFVHDLPLPDYLRPDPQLNAMLARLPLPKAILTNADAAHARRVLDQLGLTRHFGLIIDIRALGFVNKPQPEAYERALTLLNAQPAECMLIEDLPQNLRPAQALGLITVLVSHGRGNGVPPAGVDYQVDSILGVERIIAGLLGQVR
jgi:putative hydrolase of the HAD superfamily